MQLRWHPMHAPAPELPSLPSGQTRRVVWLSVGAVVAAATATAASIALVLASDSDPSAVRWWLVVAPMIVTAVPLVLPRRAVRLGAAIAVGAWCVVASASIGLLFVPAVVLLVLSTRDRL